MSVHRKLSRHGLITSLQHGPKHIVSGPGVSSACLRLYLHACHHCTTCVYPISELLHHLLQTLDMDLAASDGLITSGLVGLLDALHPVACIVDRYLDAMTIYCLGLIADLATSTVQGWQRFVGVPQPK